MKLIDYSNAMINARKNDNYEKVKEEYYKRCFELLESAKDEPNKLQLISKEEGISTTIIRNYAKEYALNNLGYTVNEWDSKYGLSNQSSQLIKRALKEKEDSILILISKLKEEEDPKKIISIIENNIGYYTIEEFEDKISSVIIKQISTEKDYLIKLLKEKINIYSTYKLNSKKEREEFIKSNREAVKKRNLIIKEHQRQITYSNMKDILKIFIEGNFESKKQFCDIYGIEIKQFDLLIELAQEYDLDTYQEYKNLIDKQQNKRYLIILEKVKQIICYLKNGIESEKGVFRPFDIIDYYMITKLDFNALLKIINSDNNLTKEEFILLKKFIAKNKNNIKNKSNEITTILNPGSVKIIEGRIISQEEKELIVDFLKQNNIPSNSITFNIALKRYLNNTLPIEKKQDVKIHKLTNNNR